MEFYNDDLDVLDLIANGFPRRINHRAHHFDEMDNLTFFKRFRLTRPTVLSILERIEDNLEYLHDRNVSVSPINQLLTALRFYATGAHLSTVADFMGIHEATASRIVQRVSFVLSQLRPLYINMPAGDEIISMQSSFFDISSFPRVAGCIDCTHIRLQSPGGDEGEVFRNRKGYFSMNVQAICSPDLKFMNIVARWPGSSHDSTVFNNSRIKTRFDNNEFPNCILLGDSGYPLKNYLLTPLAQPVTRGEQLYNEAHIRTRNCVERLFGVWKRRFPVLSYGLRLKLEASLSVIVATAVLHNIARTMNENEPPIDEELHNIQHFNYLVNIGMIPDQPIHNNGHFANANVYRNQIVQYFENL